MAKDKKSIVFYTDWINLFEGLEDDEAGKLIKHLLRYVNDFNPDPPDRLTKIAFEPIKLQLKRDLKKYEKVCDRNRDNANVRWAMPKDATALNGIKKVPNDARNADKDKDKDKDKEREKENTPAILESNLFRKPKIPTKQQVWETFSNYGGTKEMAKKFFDTYDASGWFNKNGPITNFISLVPGYVQSWKDIKNKGNWNGQSAPTLKTVSND